MNEAYGTEAVGYLKNEHPLKSWLSMKIRPWAYKIAARMIRILENKRHFCIFALSIRAVEQFEKAGFPKEQIYPFGYFIPKSSELESVTTGVRKVKRLVFVGSLIDVKGISLLVEAAKMVLDNGLNFSLDFYGPGMPELHIPENHRYIRYKGVIPFGEAQSVIAKYDALVLPSLHDGWGLVVNEALLQGVPAIVSSNVGAKCIVEASGAGDVFEAGEVEDLIRVLKRFIADMNAAEQMKKKALEIGEMISPKHAAQYLMEVISHFYQNVGVRPGAVWCG